MSDATEHEKDPGVMAGIIDGARMAVAIVVATLGAAILLCALLWLEETFGAFAPPLALALLIAILIPDTYL